MSFYEFARAVVKVYYKIFYRVKIEGLENIPKEDGYIVCANHKSLNDPPLLAVELPIKFRFMAKEELFENKVFGAFLRFVGAFPVKRGKNDIAALRAAISILSNKENLMIFPEGARSPKGYMHKGKPGTALIAIKSRVRILPVGIDGGYKPFSKITIRVGKPISMEQYYDERLRSDKLQEITDERLMPAISQLSGVSTYENRDC